MRSDATVASTARPIAPPTCTVVLTRPEARPESLRVAPDIASVIKRREAGAGARAQEKHHREQVDDVVSVDRGSREGSSPAPENTRPAISAARGPMPMMMRSA